METTTLTKISSVEFKEDLMLMTIDNKTYQWKLKDISEKLTSANDIEKNTFVISPSGYGIHWTLLDEDLSVNGLMKSLPS